MGEYLWQVFHRLIQELDITSYRYLYNKLELNDQMTGIIGPRGVGKTTMLLQYIKNKLYDSGETFYFSADNTYFNEVSILEFVDDLYQNKGIRFVFIDEIHRYPNWNQELKNIYDSYPNLKVVFSGSSSIDLIHGSYDLSRRARLIQMPGLSFREYLNLTTDNNFSSVTFNELIANHNKLSAELSQIPTILKHFEDYKNLGYYPFILQDRDALYEAISSIIDKTINEDIANFYQLKTSSLNHFKRIINFLASIPPGKVNPSNVAKHLSIDYKTVEHYLGILNKTGMVKMLYPAAHGNQILTKASKIYLDNATLLSAVNTFLSSELDIGTQRELTFLQSVNGAGIQAFYPEKGDFTIEDITFEVGGKNKTMQQLSNIKKGKRMLVKDNIVAGFKETIPLYLFGFLY
ncbi:MAG: AAA family ATPase [Coxiellaceae bacterium]|nr:AAA family ATPase [Coxiellaceae bacterium]